MCIRDRRTVVEQLTGDPMAPLEFTEVRGMQGVKEASYPLPGRTVRVCVASGLHNVKRVLDGIRDTYLKKGEQGWELHGICASAGLGPGPDNRTDRTGTPEYYLSEKQMVDNQHGAAACMMAVSEQLRRA